MTEAYQPFSPPRFCGPLVCGGRVGPEPEHFRVEEIPAYELSGQGEHVFLWIEKRRLNTSDVAKRLARLAGMKERDVGYAGMKDKHAVTRQWFSLCTKDDTAHEWDLGPDARILKATRHGNKLRTGHLIGNRFEITLVDVPRDAERKAEKVAEKIRGEGIPNYFGPQRFGREGKNLAQALTWLRQKKNSGSGDPGGERNADAQAHEEDSKRRRRKGKGRNAGAHFENKMMPSVLQSEIFNRYIAARLASDVELYLGEVVRLSGAGKGFVIADVEVEIDRYRRRDFLLTGPMIGPKGLQAEADAKKLESAVLAEFGLDEADLAVLSAHAPGARRDLMLYPEDLKARETESGALLLTFGLPAGAYATQVVREFSGAEWLTPRGPDPGALI